MADAGDSTENAGIVERLMALEVKASFTEDLADELNRTVARQQQQIEALARELMRLRGQVEELGEQDGAGDGTRQEVPPHY
ncbi:MAG: SlyX family protein [Rhodocyclaceae bacterium]|nr:SlyX family protein [Rhodocyclaceae bacterium]MCA3073525.1 SlyX family protein [Rhodocyclaceae bacterium]MCA3088507.1 SlyX family protein [Rhodocyclaceae bacterium]MCA3094407.1 SlyX family protein [Rhodocyclaceae bacterium]MCA3100015.1 SlyX family protein [Rhodocyclaceae bacterium]